MRLPGRVLPVAVGRRNRTARLLDADSHFHGVTLIGVAQRWSIGAAVRTRDSLFRLGDDRRTLQDSSGDERAVLGSDELRTAIMWKAHCFRSNEELSLYQRADHQLTFADVRLQMEDDLLERGALTRRDATEQQFAEAAVTEYIPMPDWAPFPFVPHLTDSAVNR
jgi:hypothetical protein